MSEKTSKILIVIGALFLTLFGVSLYKLFEYQGYGENKVNNKVLNYNIDDYIEINKLAYNNYSDVYSDIKVELVTFKNLDSSLTNSFINRENELINYIALYYKNIKNNNYTPINTVSSNIRTQINGTTLSVLYELDFDLDSTLYEDSHKKYFITTNIDLATNKVLNNDELLSKYDYTKDYIADKIFTEDILIGNNEIVIDKNTNISLTKDDLIRRKKYYTDKIISEFDNIVEIYIDNSLLTLVYDKQKLNDLFFENNLNTDVKYRYLR